MANVDDQYLTGASWILADMHRHAVTIDIDMHDFSARRDGNVKRLKAGRAGSRHV